MLFATIFPNVPLAPAEEGPDAGPYFWLTAFMVGRRFRGGARCCGRVPGKAHYFAARPTDDARAVAVAVIDQKACVLRRQSFWDKLSAI
jgi:hypothetical protein